MWESVRTKETARMTEKSVDIYLICRKKQRLEFSNIWLRAWKSSKVKQSTNIIISLSVWLKLRAHMAWKRPNDNQNRTSVESEWKKKHCVKKARNIHAFTNFNLIHHHIVHCDCGTESTVVVLLLLLLLSSLQNRRQKFSHLDRFFQYG